MYPKGSVAADRAPGARPTLDGDRRKLLERARQSYDEFAAARGTDARAPTARARSAAIAALLKRPGAAAPGPARGPEPEPEPDGEDEPEPEQNGPTLIFERTEPVSK